MLRSSDDEGVYDLPVEAHGESGDKEDEDEDEEDVDWEEARSIRDDTEEEESDGDVMPDDYDDDGNELTVELDKGSGSPGAPDKRDDKGKGKKKKKRGRTHAEMLYDWKLHCCHLVSLLARGRLVSSWARDEEVVVHALSILPQVLYHDLHKDLPSVQEARRLMEWFRETFEVLEDHLATDHEGREGSQVPRLKRVVEQRAGCGHELVQVFIALCHALGWRVRYMAPLDLISYIKPPHRKKAKDSGGKSEVVDLTKKGRGNGVVSGPVGSFVWVEVFCGESGKNPSTEALAPMMRDPPRGESSSRGGGGGKLEVIDILSDDEAEVQPMATAVNDEDNDVCVMEERSLSISNKRAASSRDSPAIKDRDGKRKARKTGTTHGRLPSPQEDSGNRWVHVDVVRGLFDNPVIMEEVKPRKLGGSRLLRYVIAFDPKGKITDVTMRYTSDWQNVHVNRSTKFLNVTLRKFNAPLEAQRVKEYMANQSLSMESQMEFEIEEQEKRDLKRSDKVSSEQMPRTQEGFKHSSVYILEKFLTRFQCVYPYKPAGVFKGQKVFLRSNIQNGRTATQWMRQGRVVRVDQKEKPVKVLDPSKGKGKGKRKRDEVEEGGGAEEDEEDQASASSSHAKGGIFLYVEAQTEPYVAPDIVDGIIPKNEHGNIEIWGADPIFVPRGACHIPLRGIEKVAKKLGIDYAPALVGFEVSRGRSVPDLLGVVVSNDNRAILLDAYHTWNFTELEKKSAAKEARMVKAWERITRLVIMRRHVHDKYGGQNEQGAGSSSGSKPCKARHSKPTY